MEHTESPGAPLLRRYIRDLGYTIAEREQEIREIEEIIERCRDFDQEDMDFGYAPSDADSVNRRRARVRLLKGQAKHLNTQMEDALGSWRRQKWDTERDNCKWNEPSFMDPNEFDALRDGIGIEAWFGQFMAVFECGPSLRRHSLWDPEWLEKTIADDRRMRMWRLRMPGMVYTWHVEGVPLDDKPWSRKFDRADMQDWVNKVGGNPDLSGRTSVFRSSGREPLRESPLLGPDEWPFPPEWEEAPPESPPVAPNPSEPSRSALPGGAHVLYGPWEVVEEDPRSTPINSTGPSRQPEPELLDGFAVSSPLPPVPSPTIGDDRLPGVRELQLPTPSIPVSASIPAPCPGLPKRRRSESDDGEEPPAPGPGSPKRQRRDTGGNGEPSSSPGPSKPCRSPRPRKSKADAGEKPSSPPPKPTRSLKRRRGKEADGEKPSDSTSPRKLPKLAPAPPGTRSTVLRGDVPNE